jgi:hypothetical protein
VSKTTYADLFNVIGDAYTNELGLTVGSGKPWKQQYLINDLQDGDITGWATDTSLPGALGWSQAIVTKNRVYLLGGDDGSAAASTVYTAPINTDGTLGAWTTDTSLPSGLYASQAIVTKNRIYLLGGYDVNNSVIATVYTIPINTDGTLGTWIADTSLPVTRSHIRALTTKNRVYLLGGWSGGAISDVIHAPINADGTLGTWSTGTSMPVATASSDIVATSSRIYIIGGHEDNNLFMSTVQSAPVSGGLNDYSPYYDGTITAVDPNTFRLPDYTGKDNLNSIYHFIKT